MTDRSGLSGRPAFDRVMGYIRKAKEDGGDVLIGGTGLLHACSFPTYGIDW